MKISVNSAANIGNAIRLTRLSQGLDQMAIAALTSSAQSFISHVENGKETAQIGKVLALLDALGIGVELSFPEDVAQYISEHLTPPEKTANQKKSDEMHFYHSTRRAQDADQLFKRLISISSKRVK